MESKLNEIIELRGERGRSEALLSAGFLARSHVFRSLATRPDLGAKPHFVGPDCKSAFDLLENLNPSLFGVWKDLHKNEEKFYVEDTAGSCSHWDHKYARLFGAFVSLYARGRLLDIGCGVNGMPSYLAGYPRDLITGLDPRPSRVAVDFEYVQGLNEFLPWADGSFSTVVSGTSLDHVLLLDKSLSEVDRILVQGGVYLVWLASIPGAKPYRPDDRGFKPADHLHLFHFDRTWIEPILSKYFSIDDVCILPQPGFDHVFYCLSKKP